MRKPSDVVRVLKFYLWVSAAKVERVLRADLFPADEDDKGDGDMTSLWRTAVAMKSKPVESIEKTDDLYRAIKRSRQSTNRLHDLPKLRDHTVTLWSAFTMNGPGEENEPIKASIEAIYLGDLWGAIYTEFRVGSFEKPSFREQCNALTIRDALNGLGIRTVGHESRTILETVKALE